MTTIAIAKDFSDVPAGRYKKDGAFSGEQFRDDLLRPRLQSSETVEVILDDVEGYGSSFLEEAFGGLVRVAGFTPDELHKKLKLVARTAPYRVYVTEIWDYIDSAKKQ
ncbi:MAG: STAS-like domain-containing protein [Ferrovibrio sp.]|uniref:STAS-like domain-containing protein n=1 Tax=Ferrovibrio sp. TaxID=1917215 RepID=UPI003919DA45